MENVFDRTAIFQKEKRDDGRIRIRRIPWDLVGFGNAGALISPMPVDMAPLSSVLTTTTVIESHDMLCDEAKNDLIDEITDLMYFESEQIFYSKFEGVFGYYQTTDPSAEFGYPRS